MFLRGPALLLILGALLCIRYAVIWLMPDCKLKRLLLTRVSHERDGGAGA